MGALSVEGWQLPDGSWDLHLTDTALGGLTDRWIDTQLVASITPARLLGPNLAAGVPRRPEYLVAADSLWSRLAARGAWRSRGATTRLLARHLSSPAPRALHAHYGTVAANFLPLARSLGRPLVAGFYGFDATLERLTGSRRWRRQYDRLFREAEAVIVEGPVMGDRVVALGCDPQRINIVRLPADETSLARITRRRPQRFVAVMAGRFVEKKGFDTGIRAFAKAFADRPDAELVLIGGGPLEQHLRSVARECGIAERCRWAGRLAFEEFMAQIASSSVALFPSRTATDGDSEGGAPVTLIEAQWLGVPAVVSSCDDLAFVAPDDHPLVLGPLDVGEWAMALIELERNPAQLDRLGERAKAHARDLHSPKANAIAREALYARVGSSAPA